MSKAKYFALQNTFTKEWVCGYGSYHRPKIYDSAHIVSAIRYWGYGGISNYDRSKGRDTGIYPRHFDIHMFNENMNNMGIMRADHYLFARGYDV